jgi:DNA repair protein RadC
LDAVLCTVLPSLLKKFLQNRLIRKNEEVILCMFIDTFLEIIRKNCSRTVYWPESTVHTREIINIYNISFLVRLLAVLKITSN